MTSEEFFRDIESYYGKYPRPGLRRDMAKYIATLAETELYGLSQYLKQTVSTQFSFVPDIEAMEKARRGIWKDKPEPLYLPAPIDPDAHDMELEEGELMAILLSKVSMRRQDEEKINADPPRE